MPDTTTTTNTKTNASEHQTSLGAYQTAVAEAAILVPNFRHELDVLHRQVDSRLDGVTAAITARLDAMDKAQRLFDTDLKRVPTDTDKQVAHLRELISERFDAVYAQMTTRDARIEQGAKDAKLALDAALVAAEKAVDRQNEAFALSISKSETASTKQIDQQAHNLQTTATGLDGKIGDVKDRVTRLEGLSNGEKSSVENQRGGQAQIIALVAVGTSILSLVAGHLWK